MKEILNKAAGHCMKAIKENTSCAMCTGNRRCEEYGAALMFMKEQNKK